jgi:DNA mismatch endonuclease, patch repair protein
MASNADAVSATRPPASSPIVRARMRATRRRDTPIEIRLRKALHRLGLRFRLQVKIRSLPRRTVDIAFPSASIAVFVDSCFWHGCPIHGSLPKTNRDWWQAKINQNRQRDAHTTVTLTREGWLVIRVWEHEEVVSASKRIAVAVKRSCRIKSGRRQG